MKHRQHYVFTVEDDERIIELVKKHKRCWSLIEREMDFKYPAVAIQNRFYNKIRPLLGDNSAPWTDEDMKRLDALVAHYGTRWTWLSEIYFDHRPPSFLKNKYNTYSRKKLENFLLKAEQKIIESQQSVIQFPELTDTNGDWEQDQIDYQNIYDD